MERSVELSTAKLAGRLKNQRCGRAAIGRPFVSLSEALPDAAQALALVAGGVLQRRASYETRKGRCSTLICCMSSSLNRGRFKDEDMQQGCRATSPAAFKRKSVSHGLTNPKIMQRSRNAKHRWFLRRCECSGAVRFGITIDGILETGLPASGRCAVHARLRPSTGCCARQRRDLSGAMAAGGVRNGRMRDLLGRNQAERSCPESDGQGRMVRGGPSRARWRRL